MMYGECILEKCEAIMEATSSLYNTKQNSGYMKAVFI
jgi:hypothetical protein